ncbi:MAG: twin-arginine translocase subunit TatC [Corynebacterium sp.]|nr:twin-arginine translocase subunit TatC [Corynebacterium sp.]
MSLVEHIQELRRRLIISLIALFIGTVLGYLWYQATPFGITSLGDILRGPYCSLPDDVRANLSADGTCKLLATGPFDMFMLRLKVGFLAGVVFASPVWLSQIWAFVAPGLHKNEKRYTFTFVALAVFLFVCGAVLAYVIIDYGLDFLLSIGSDTQVAALSGEQYFHFLLALLIIFGISFEVPLFIVVLNIVGVLSYDAVKSKRRLIVVVIFFFAAVITPGQDPFSMTCLALALAILVELAFQFCRINDKKRKNRRPDWMDLPDDAASGPIDAAAPIGHADSVIAASPVDKAGPIAPAGPVNPPQPMSPPPAPNAQSQRQYPGSNFDDIL